MAGGRRLCSLLVVLWCAGGGARALDLRIGVVETPERAARLAAAVEAALGAEAPPPLEARTEPGSPLAVPQAVCALAAAGAGAALAGGGGGARLAAEGAARAALPLLLVDAAPAAPDWEALAMYPDPDVLAQACATLCSDKAWREAVLLHEGSARGAALIAPDSSQLTLLARQLPPDDGDLRNLLLVLKKSGATNFIVWCGAACCTRVLDAAQRVGLLSERHSYIALTTDLHTQALHAYSHGGANVTSLQLFDPESEEVRAIMEAWRVAYLRRLGDDVAAEAAAVVAAPPTALLLAYDAARLVAAAAARLPLPPQPFDADCGGGRGAFHANTLLNYLRSEEWNASLCVSGGGAAWEADGARREVALRAVELARGGRLQEAARWTPRDGLTWKRRAAPPAERPPDSMTNRTFTVIIATNAPYVMTQESTDRLSGNARYEGFCIELIDRLAQQLHFNYTFVLQPNNTYGSYNNNTQQWDGMMGRLMRDPDIDFAITDLTITAEREKAVDFTTPFMNLGIGILFRTPTEPEPDLFAFLLPFSKDVWLCLGFAYLGTSLLLYVVGRLCPEEWQNPYPCIEEPVALENQFTLANALWFNLGAVLLQGSEIAPVAYGTRAVASVWWLFALVITSSYTANLATLLAQKSSTERIHNVQELADNDLGITYGAKINGSTYTFFEHSQNELYRRMFEHMKTQEMPKGNDEGIKKVMTEDFAFLMESTTIEYTIQRNCEVTMVGSLLDSKGYGIAMKKNSTYRQELNLALLNLQEAGILREMKNKWWNEKHGGGACNVAEERESEELQMPNFLGLFLVLTVGCALGLALSVADLALAAARRPRDPARTFVGSFWDELRFVFRFDRSEKPLQGPLLSESSSGSPPRSSSPAAAPGEDSPPEERPRSRSASPDAASGGVRTPRRRRSSMHAASLRLARHAHPPRHSKSPSQQI